MGVGMPAHMHLDLFGLVVQDAFGHRPYLVGSAVEGKQWRDVDVRLILPDDEWEGLFGPALHQGSPDPKWSSVCMAYSALGKEMTGLPIDFQIQSRSHANGCYGDQRRDPLAIRVQR